MLLASQRSARSCRRPRTSEPEPPSRRRCRRAPGSPRGRAAAGAAARPGRSRAAAPGRGAGVAAVAAAASRRRRARRARRWPRAPAASTSASGCGAWMWQTRGPPMAWVLRLPGSPAIRQIRISAVEPRLEAPRPTVAGHASAGRRGRAADRRRRGARAAPRGHGRRRRPATARPRSTRRASCPTTSWCSTATCPSVHGDDVCRTLSRRAAAHEGADAHRGALAPTSSSSGLALGADDYLAKPFRFAELVARLRALGAPHGRGAPAGARGRRRRARPGAPDGHARGPRRST